MAPQFEIHFTFRGKERTGRARKYSDGSFSVGFTGDDELIQDFTGIIFFYPDGSADYHKDIVAADKKDFEGAVRAQLK